MKLEEKKLTVLGGLGEKTYSAKISEEDIGKLWELIQAPYKNPIESLIRESCSNSIDAHTEAKVDDAVIVRLGKDETSYYISFIDVGVGMSEDRIENIYINYLKSTKTASNEQLGAFGMGSKSPLSYNDYFFITTRFNGVERRLMMRKGEVKPELDVLEVLETTERNGTEIRVDIKSSNDFEQFIYGCYNQLRYFPNVVFDFTNTDQLITTYSNSRFHKKALEGDYNLIHGRTFVYRDGNVGINYNGDDLHLLLGNVVYPIDFNILKINRIKCDVGLKFEIGELPVIQTREDIRYNDKAKKLILDRIEEFKEELLERLETKEVKANNLQEFNVLCNESNYITIGTYNPLKIQLDTLITDVKLNEKKKPIQLKDLGYTFKTYEESYSFKVLLTAKLDRIQAISFDCNKKFSTDGKVIKNSNGAINNSIRTSRFYNETIIDILYYLDQYTQLNNFPRWIVNSKNEFNSKTNKYLFDKLNYYDAYFIRRVSVNIIRPLFGLNKKIGIDKEAVKALIKYLYKQMSNVYNSMTKYSDIKVDEAWWKDALAEKKTNKNIVEYDRSKLAIEKHYTIFQTSVNYDRTDYRPDLAEFIRDSKQVDYCFLIHKDDKVKYTSGAHNSSTKFEQLVGYMHHFMDKKISINITADRNYNKILKARSEVSNIFTVEEFMKNSKIKVKTIGKIATVFKIKEYLDMADVTNSSYNFYSDNRIQKLVNDIMNPIFIKDYTTIFNYMRNLESYRGLSKYISEMMSDFNQLDDLTEIYDRDMLDMFYKNVKLFTEYNFYVALSCNLSVYHFMNTFKPKSMYYMLNDKWYLFNSGLIMDINTKLKEQSISKICEDNIVNSPNHYYHDKDITSFKKYRYLNNILKQELVRLEIK